jgi:hypothetical protein
LEGNPIPFIANRGYASRRRRVDRLWGSRPIGGRDMGEPLIGRAAVEIASSKVRSWRRKFEVKQCGK